MAGETRHQRLEERRRLVERALSAALQHPVSRLLTAELTPSRTWGLNLRTFLRSAEWEALSHAVSTAAGGRCEVCGGVGRRHPVEAHEVWAWVGHTQRLVRLVALCPRCHGAKHAGLTSSVGREDDVVDQLRKVNGWAEPQARSHLKDARNDWARRQATAWELDLSVLGIELTDELVAWAQDRADRKKAAARRRDPTKRPGRHR